MQARRGREGGRENGWRRGVEMEADCERERAGAAVG